MVSAFLLLLISNIMLVAIARIPPFFPYVLGNTLLLIGFALLHFSFPEVRARARTQLVLSIALAAWVFFGDLITTYAYHSHLIRILFTGSALAIQSGATAYILARFSEPSARYPNRSTAAIFGLLSAIQTSRLLWIAIHRIAPDEVSGSPMRWIALLGYAVVAATIPILYFWTMTVRLQGRLEQLAFTDPLTGLLNRRSIEQEGNIELSRLTRSPTAPPLSLILLDLDYFKQLNDRYGHPAGDHVLQHLATVVSPSLRVFDRLARIGGEEFLILLPQTTFGQALDIAERIRVLIEATIFRFDDKAISVTASLGVATTLPTTESWSNLMSRADASLYQAKRLGRNRVAV